MSPLRPLNDSQRLVYTILKAAGDRGVTTSELVQLKAGNRFSARIMELRSMPGCVIHAERVGKSAWRYTLVASPEVERARGTSQVAPEVRVAGPLSLGDELALFDGDKQKPIGHYEDL